MSNNNNNNDNDDNDNTSTNNDAAAASSVTRLFHETVTSLTENVVLLQQSSSLLQSCSSSSSSHTTAASLRQLNDSVRVVEQRVSTLSNIVHEEKTSLNALEQIYRETLQQHEALMRLKKARMMQQQQQNAETSISRRSSFLSRLESASDNDDDVDDDEEYDDDDDDEDDDTEDADTTVPNIRPRLYAAAAAAEHDKENHLREHHYYSTTVTTPSMQTPAAVPSIRPRPEAEHDKENHHRKHSFTSVPAVMMPPPTTTTMLHTPTAAAGHDKENCLECILPATTTTTTTPQSPLPRKQKNDHDEDIIECLTRINLESPPFYGKKKTKLPPLSPRKRVIQPIKEQEFLAVPRTIRGRIPRDVLDNALRDIMSVVADDTNTNNHHDQVPTISEQELRKSCTFFRWGESTARRILSILCTLKRLHQVPSCSKGKIMYNVLLTTKTTTQES